MNYSLAKKFTFGSLMMFALPTTVMMIFTSLYTIIDWNKSKHAVTKLCICSP